MPKLKLGGATAVLWAGVVVVVAAWVRPKLGNAGAAAVVAAGAGAEVGAAGAAGVKANVDGNGAAAAIGFTVAVDTKNNTTKYLKFQF